MNERSPTPMKKSSRGENSSRHSAFFEELQSIQFWGKGWSESRSDSVKEIHSTEEICEIIPGEAHVFLRTSKQKFLVVGLNDFGQLGVEAISELQSPTDLHLTESISIVKLFTGPDYVFALGAKQELLSWGLNFRGQLGIGPAQNHEKLNVSQTSAHSLSFVSAPTHVKGLSSKYKFEDFFLKGAEGVVSIACGSLHSVLLTDFGRVFVCGAGETFALGLGNKKSISVFSELSFFRETELKVEKVRAGVAHSGALVNGQVYAWGFLGKDPQLRLKRPNLLVTDSQIHDFVMGDMLTVLLTNGGDILTLGENSHCQLGFTGDAKLTLTPVALSCKIESVNCGLNHVIAISKKKIFGWGSNEGGQLVPYSSEKFFDKPEELGWLCNSDVLDVICGPLTTFLISKKPVEIPKYLNNNEETAKIIRVLDREIENFKKMADNLKTINEGLQQDITDLYSTLKSNKEPEDPLTKIKNELKQSRTLRSSFEIDFNSIKIISKISEGGFGIISRGIWRELEVAVKMLRKECLKEENIVDFLSKLTRRMLFDGGHPPPKRRHVPWRLH